MLFTRHQEQRRYVFLLSDANLIQIVASGILHDSKSRAGESSSPFGQHNAPASMKSRLKGAKDNVWREQGTDAFPDQIF